MIYIITLIILLLLIYFFDLRDKGADTAVLNYTPKMVGSCRNESFKDLFKNKKISRRELYYWIIFVWFALVSGLSYNVGSDIVDYMNDYDDFSSFWRVHVFSDIFDYGNMRPGWVLLNVICSNICPDFLLLKLIIGVFVNYSIFRFIKKNTSFWYTCLFLYAVTVYLNLNFNALRQAMAVACFLWGYNYLIEKKYIKYLIWALAAFMFHSSALICLFLPLLSLIKLNKLTLSILGGALIVGTIYVLGRNDIDQIAYELFMKMDFGGDIGENLTMLGERYTGENAAKSNSMNINGLIMVLSLLFFIILTLVFNIKHNKSFPMLNSAVMVIYAMMVVLDYTIPVLFFRFMYYFQFIYFCLLANLFVMLPRKYFKQFRFAFTTVFLAIYMIKPVTTLYAENEATGLPLLVQFYPYHSVIDHEIDPVRNTHFGSHR